MTRRRHRRILIVRGSLEETREQACELIGGLEAGEVLWVGDGQSPEGVRQVTLSTLQRHLGESYDAVVLDLHGEFDANAIGQAHGLIRGGGGLVVRLSKVGEQPTGICEGLAAYPYGAEDVGVRFWGRLEEKLARGAFEDVENLTPPNDEPEGTEEQGAAVGRLVELWSGEAPENKRREAETAPHRRYGGDAAAPRAAVVVTADRGRGKSSALGMAIRKWRASAEAEPTVAVTGRYPDSTAEIFRFALETEEIPRSGPVRYVPISKLLAGELQPDLVVVDEAAQFSVPVLRRLVESSPDTHLAFATTTHGYEGTGRGFSVRFVDWLEKHTERFDHIELQEPIRWGSGDPLERLVFDALLLDAEPADIAGRVEGANLEHRRLDRDALADEERLLRQFFGLLVQAHYRTTPGDLHRMLDAPNLHLHALLLDGDVVAATWAAEEGRLSPQLAEKVYGGHRLRGHALPEILLANLSRPETGDLEIVRSVRTAVHPDYRRRGLGTRLIEDVQDSYEPDLFGTIFGATPGVIRFRRQLGHEIVRMSPSRGRRAGEPSVAMMRPVSTRAQRLVDELRNEYARKLPIQLDLMHTDEELAPSDELVDQLRAGLPDVVGPLDDQRMRQVVDHYADGPPTYESAAFALDPFVERHADLLPELEETHRHLIEARVRDRASWRETVERATVETVRAAMRGLRRAVAGLRGRIGGTDDRMNGRSED